MWTPTQIPSMIVLTGGTNQGEAMGKKSVGAKVNVPGVGSGTVETAPKIVKGVEVQDVRTGMHTVIAVPVKKL